MREGFNSYTRCGVLSSDSILFFRFTGIPISIYFQNYSRAGNYPNGKPQAHCREQKSLFHKEIKEVLKKKIALDFHVFFTMLVLYKRRRKRSFPPS